MIPLCLPGVGGVRGGGEDPMLWLAMSLGFNMLM